VRKFLSFVVLCAFAVGAGYFISQDLVGIVSRSSSKPHTTVDEGKSAGRSTAANRSVIVRKVESGEAAPVVVGPRRTIPERASPMAQPSADELKRFPTAKVLMAGSVVGPGANQVTQVRILDTDFKYPHVRTEEVIDQSTGQVLLREEMVADHLLVTLEEGQDPAILGEQMGDAVTSVERVSPDVPLYRVHLATVSLEGLPEGLELANKQAVVVLAEPDYIRQAVLVPNDPKYLDGTLWGLNQASDADVDAPEGWNVRTSADGVVVAVIDTGIRYTHQDLAANMWKNPREIPGNRVDDDQNGVVDDVYGLDSYNNDGDPMDGDGHGTHCAGTIGGVGNNGVGVTGIAWGVKLMGCKFLSDSGSGTDSDAIRCIDYARIQGAKVLSNSWGGGGANSSLQAAIERCRAAGMLFVAAAGNESSNNDSWASYPASFPTDNIISVAATTRTDRLASYSNYGRVSVDLGAPGDQIYSTVATSDSSYDTYSGSSMATPHVAGALAMLAAQFPNESYTSLLTRLLDGTDKIASLATKTKSGGRLNLAKALAAATPSTPIRPVNDAWIGGTIVSGTFWSVSGSNQDATSETGEPNHAGDAPAKSIWWKWTAPSSGTCTITTSGSTFDTLLAVYKGTSVQALTAVGSNDNESTTRTSSLVSFAATSGTTYQIAVDGKAGAYGSITLKGELVQAGPANDNFEKAILLNGNTFSVGGSNVGATAQIGEPKHAGERGGKSVWWCWTAPANGTLILTTAGSAYDTLLAVYTGAEVAALSVVRSNDDESSILRTSRTTTSVVAGEVYRIAVDGYQGNQGTIQLAGSFEPQIALQAPTGVSAAWDSRNRVSVAWNAVPSAAKYEISIYVGTTVYASGVVTDVNIRTSGSFSRSIKLSAKVRAINAAGVAGPWSTAVLVR